MQKEDLTNPSYYTLPDGKQSIDVLKERLTTDEFRGFLKGNKIKYDSRAGKKRHLTEQMVDDLVNCFPDKESYGAAEVATIIYKWKETLNSRMSQTDKGKGEWYENKLKEFDKSFVGKLRNVTNWGTLIVVVMVILWAIIKGLMGH